MGFKCGIVGLPNVGKSTIFNALTSANAVAANYPFCTIEPNTGIVPVPDPRFYILAKLAKSEKIIPTTIEFVDIAGLVEGAPKGEGLGNQFLGHIRAVDAVIHVVRCFKDGEITHVYGDISPRRDIEVIETELLLADITTVEKRLKKIVKIAKGGNKEAQEELEVLEFAQKELSAGRMLRKLDDPAQYLKTLGLLTAKPILFVVNVSESEASVRAEESKNSLVIEARKCAAERNAGVIAISGGVGAEISQLAVEEREEFLTELGLEQSGLSRLTWAGYRLLDLITFFTVGPKETHAWTCESSATAPIAAGKIHTDFEKGFIRAEIISYHNYVQYGGEIGAKEKGLLRVEGKTYTMQDGDIVHFRFNV